MVRLHANPHFLSQLELHRFSGRRPGSRRDGASRSLVVPLKRSYNHYRHHLKPGDLSEHFISMKIQITLSAAAWNGVIVYHFVF